MVSAADRSLYIELPADLVGTGEPRTLRLEIVDDRQVQGGKKAVERTYEDANTSTPTRRQRVEWAIHGPIGASLESASGYLGVNLVQNLETRWFQRMLPGPLRTSVDLTSLDPPGVDGSYFGTAIFGTSYFGSPLGTGHDGNGPDVVVFAQQQRYLIVVRGALITQVDTTTTPWTVVDTQVMDAEGLDADHWRGTVKVALGSTSAMQRVVSASSSGMILGDVSSTSPSGTVYASAIKRGSDRAWYIDAEPGSTFNFAGYTLDDFVNLAAPFQVGDPDAGMNGIGPFGPFTMFGGVDNLYSFTDQGKPIPLSRSLYSHHSVLNGNQWADPGWGWNFATSGIGLRAVSQGGYDNPVGIGETMRQFTGHNGIAYTVYSERGELWVIYRTTAGALYGYRGTFGAETANSGQPLLFPWFYKANAWSQAIFSTVTGAADQGVYIINGNGTNLEYSLIASDGRDDMYSDYDYACVGTDASWNLAFAFDAKQTEITSATYTSIGNVTTNGAQTLTPVSSGAPVANISGRTITPRLRLTDASGNTYTAYLTTLNRDVNLLKTLRLARFRTRGMDDASNPPEIDGTLEVEYDARPAQFQRISVACYLPTVNNRDWNQVWARFQQLAGQDSAGPFKIQVPGDLVPGVSTASGGGTLYAMVSAVTKRQDVMGDRQAVGLVFDTWPQAEAV